MSDSSSAEKIANEDITIHDERRERTQLDPTGTTTDPSAHVLDIKELGPEGRGLQLTPDGKTVLIPQPSSDPHDPLNWSPFKKLVILFVVTVTAFMADFGSSMGVVALLPQAV